MGYAESQGQLGKTIEGYAESQGQLGGLSKTIDFGLDDDEDEVPNQNKKKKKEKGFLEWIFGWIIDPITAIIEGIIAVVMFVINTIKFFINLPWCAKWYVFGLIGSILYLLPQAFFLVFGLQKIEKQIFKIRNKLDDLIFCNTGYNILRYSDVIREGCYFQKKIKRNCGSDDFDPLQDIMEMLSDFFSDLTTFNYITVVTSLSMLLFISLIVYYLIQPLLKKSVVDKPV